MTVICGIITISMATLMESLCVGKLPSRNVVIEDMVEAPGRFLAQVLLHGMCQRYDEVVLLAPEMPGPSLFLQLLPASLKEKVRVAQVPKPRNYGERLPVGPLMEGARSVIQGSGGSVGVLIASVSKIVFAHSASAVPQLVHSMLGCRERGNKVEQVVSVIHGDVHGEAVCRVVSGRADTVVQLYPPPPSSSRQYACRVRHGEVWQRPAFQTEEFSISKGCRHLQDVVGVSKVDAVRDTSDQSQVDPTANLTFNLSLKPEEKAAKDQVVLPYTQISSSSENQGGAIHYIPDDDDDFDDEDLDEDLDF